MNGIRDWVIQHWQRSMLQRALLVAPPVALLLLVGFLTYGTRPRVEYYTRAVDRGAIEQVVQATGTINAVTTVQVGSQVSGKIAAINVDFNSRVKKGEVIAQIDPATFRSRLVQAEADLENAQANVKSLEAQIETARADVLASRASVDRVRAQAKDAESQLKRTKELAQQGITAQAQLDTAQATSDSAAAEVGVAEAQLQQAQSRLKATQAQADQARAQVAQRRAAAESARVDLGYTTITAPIDGTVIARNVDVGQTVAASLQAPTLFVIAQDLTKMLVYAKTDEADVGRIRVGATARFRVDSFPRQEFHGTVSQVRMNATTVQNVVTYDTIVEFDNPGQRLFPGMTAYVTIPIEYIGDTVRVPNGALRFKPDLSDEQLTALYAKYKIPVAGARAGARGASAGPGAGGPGRVRDAAGGTASAGDGQRGAMRATDGQNGGRPGDRCNVVWKLTSTKQIEPVCVNTGVTDYTFTEVKDDGLKEGDLVVIGQTAGRAGGDQRSQSPMNRFMRRM